MLDTVFACDNHVTAQVRTRGQSATDDCWGCPLAAAGFAVEQVGHRQQPRSSDVAPWRPCGMSTPKHESSLSLEIALLGTAAGFHKTKFTELPEMIAPKCAPVTISKEVYNILLTASFSLM